MTLSLVRPVLPFALSPRTVADACRDAALAFCRGAGAGWTKRDLARWLDGPYMAAAGWVDASLAPPVEDPPPSMRPPTMELLAQPNIASLLDPAWQEAVSLVEALATGSPDEYFEEAMTRGSMVEALSARGGLLLLPIHRPRLRLGVRVRSLFLADYLFRPEDYLGELATCSDCGVVLLGGEAREMGACREHARRSGMVPRGGALGDPADDSVDVDLADLDAAGGF